MSYDKTLARRGFLGMAGSGAVIVGTGGLSAMLLSFKACGPTATQATKVASQIVDGLAAAREVFAALALDQVVALIDKASSIAKDLKKALEAADTSSALTFLRDLLDPNGVVQSIALAVGLITNESQKRIVATILVIVRLALNLIATYLAAQTPATSGAQRAPVDHSQDVSYRTFELVYGVKL